MAIEAKKVIAQEHLEKDDDIKVSKEKVRQEMAKEGLWIIKGRKESEHGERRERRGNYGEMQQFDGSYHKWFYGIDEEQRLLASIDDVTGKITRAIFDKNEGINAVFSFWKGYVIENGRPTSIYLPIHTNSLQGKGRIERLWKTLRTRLRIELRLRGIKT